ncbi:hypothetical protein ABZ960_16825 [Streptomyces pseudovenezuelae]
MIMSVQCKASQVNLVNRGYLLSNALKCAGLPQKVPHRPVGSAPGFRLTGWKLDGKVLGTTEQTVSIPMTGDRTVVAEFSHGSAG